MLLFLPSTLLDPPSCYSSFHPHYLIHHHTTLPSIHITWSTIMLLFLPSTLLDPPSCYSSFHLHYLIHHHATLPSTHITWSTIVLLFLPSTLPDPPSCSSSFHPHYLRSTAAVESTTAAPLHFAQLYTGKYSCQHRFYFCWDLLECHNDFLCSFFLINNRIMVRVEPHIFWGAVVLVFVDLRTVLTLIPTIIGTPISKLHFI